MKRLVAFVLLLSVFSSNAQLEIHGSFIIAAICKDGIIMGADSRGTVSNSGRPIGYVDSIQKIFAGRDFVMGSMGAASIDDIYLASLTKSFVDTFNIVINVSSTMVMCELSLEKAIPRNKIETDHMILFFANYDKDKPTLILVKPSMIYVNRSSFIEADSSSFGSVYHPKLKCKQAKKLIEVAIKKYAKDKGLENHIGGPIYFLKVSKKNKVKWLGPRPAKTNYTKVSELVKDVIQYEKR